MKIDWIERVLGNSEPSELWSASMVFISRQDLKQLYDVVKAAKNPAITWNEDLCNSEEYAEMGAARKALVEALSALEVTGKGE